MWSKGIIVKGYDEALFRKDCCGAWIVKNEYGKQSPFGWEIDHVYPQVKGGDSNIYNLRTVQGEGKRGEREGGPQGGSGGGARAEAGVPSIYKSLPFISANCVCNTIPFPLI